MFEKKYICLYFGESLIIYIDCNIVVYIYFLIFVNIVDIGRVIINILWLEVGWFLWLLYLLNIKNVGIRIKVLYLIIWYCF